MTYSLDLHDIQGNIVKGYGRFGYPKARYFFLNFSRGEAARQLLDQFIPFVTTGVLGTGGDKPDATTNLAFTYAGLRELGLPDETMRSFPADFRMGMKARQDILGDQGPSGPEHWDPIWRDNYAVHMWISINAVDETALEQRYQTLIQLIDQTQGGVRLLSGHRNGAGDDQDYQAASAIYSNGAPTAKEHFGYTDGISDPYFEGQTTSPEKDAIGSGKVTREPATGAAGWQPLRPGEFLLGHPDEGQEYPKAPIPRLLSFNGTFMVYRKLHQNVGAFENYIEQAAQYSDDGKEGIAAKFAGRWRNGAPLTLFPTQSDADQFGSEWDAAVDTLFLNPNASDADKAAARTVYEQLKHQRKAFKYDDDLDGARCPISSHIRRTNPRGALEHGEEGAFDTPGALANRRRLLRRGLPYGDSSDRTSNTGDHGIIFMAINASIERQFEFVQQQWVHYGNDFKRSNEQDPILSNRDEGVMVIEGDASTGRPPVFCGKIPRFVETRGGDYFFIPSLTALRMIADGIIDPT